MTSKERIERIMQHKEADRVPILDKPWRGTVMRWENEGMPHGMDWRDYFGVDKVQTISADITPQYPKTVLEETEEYEIVMSPWGVTMKNFKALDSTPEFIDFKVNTAQAWLDAKRRMRPDKSRINWKYLEQNYDRWIAEGDWIEAEFWFGFDVTHSWMAGTETVLIAMYEEPEWVVDMFNTYLDMCIAQFEMVWDAGYRFDRIAWPDDMGYKNTTFFSPEMYRTLLKPVHARAVEWAHKKGIYASLHSCGDIMTLLPDVVDTGIDSLNPIEIKAGMDAVKIKREYGDKITLHGGVNAQLWDKKEQIIAEIETLLPILKEGGGYIFASDHSIPNSVSLENFREIIQTVKRVGAYTK